MTDPFEILTPEQRAEVHRIAQAEADAQNDPDTERTPRPMNDKLPSDSEALDQLAALLSQSEWNADLMEPVFRIVTQTGRTISDDLDD